MENWYQCMDWKELYPSKVVLVKIVTGRMKVVKYAITVILKMAL